MHSHHARADEHREVSTYSMFITVYIDMYISGAHVLIF